MTAGWFRQRERELQKKTGGPTAGTIRKSQPACLEYAEFSLAGLYDDRADCRWKWQHYEAGDWGTHDAIPHQGLVLSLGFFDKA